VTYDSNGNLTGDGTHTFSWDAEGKSVAVYTVTVSYDALGRMVEQARGTSYTQIVYSPLGSKLALMTGQTLQKAFVPLPGRATAVYTSSGLAYYRHPDRLGSSRFASTPSRTKYYDVAYAPYGGSYSGSGTSDLSFTGENQDTVTGLYDFLFREYNPAHGRWISPDPTGLAAVNPASPQSWNRYAYVSNSPMAMFDPLGTDCAGTNYEETDNDCGHGGWGGDPWQGYFDASNGDVLHPSEISSWLNDQYDRETFGLKYYDLPGKNDELERAAYFFEGELAKFELQAHADEVDAGDCYEDTAQAMLSVSSKGSFYPTVLSKVSGYDESVGRMLLRVEAYDLLACRLRHTGLLRQS